MKIFSIFKQVLFDVTDYTLNFEFINVTWGIYTYFNIIFILLDLDLFPYICL